MKRLLAILMTLLLMSCVLSGTAEGGTVEVEVLRDGDH